MPTGRWGIASGIMQRWRQLSEAEPFIDRQFRALWKAAKRESDSFYTLYDTEAVPSAPRPYCVFQQLEPSRVGGMGRKTNRAGKQHSLYDVPVNFVIYAFTREEAKTLAEAVMGVFENHGFWDCTPDKVAKITRLGDNPIREGERMHSWVIRYLVQVDAEETNIGAA